MNKMIKALALLASAILMGVSAPVMAQTAAATPAAPSVTVDGLVDAYYTYNFTNAAHGINGAGNIGQFWNTSDNSFSLGLAETKITAKQGNATAVVELAYQVKAHRSARVVSRNRNILWNPFVGDRELGDQNAKT